MEVDHTFLNSSMFFYFIEMTQSCIEEFISQLSMASSEMEALDYSLLGKTMLRIININFIKLIFKDSNFKLFNLTSDSYKSISNQLSRKINDFNISLDAIIRYDPTTYEGRSPKYEEIWDVLKQQASLVNFIRDLVVGRGQVALATRFIELTSTAKARKFSEGYKFTREEECVLLAKSWVS